MEPARMSRTTLSMSPFRLTARSRVAVLLSIVGAFAVSCQGSNCQTTTAPEPLTTALASRYVLTTVGASKIPATYGDSSGFQFVVYGDTLLLTLATSTYSEAGRVARREPVTGNLVFRSVVSADRFTSVGRDTYSFPKFLGGSATATAQPAYGNAILSLVTPTGQQWMFTPQ